LALINVELGEEHDPNSFWQSAPQYTLVEPQSPFAEQQSPNRDPWQVCATDEPQFPSFDTASEDVLWAEVWQYSENETQKARSLVAASAFDFMLMVDDV
jgi:hypothetical protein